MELRPRHSFDTVVDELIAGLRDGTIAIPASVEPSALADSISDEFTDLLSYRPDSHPSKEESETVARALDRTLGELDLLLRNHQEISDGVALYFYQKIRHLTTLFPTKLQRLMNESSLREARTELDFKHALLMLSVDFKLQAMHETYDAWLKTIKVKYRQQVYAFVIAREEELRKEIDERSRKYLVGARERQELYEKYKGLPVSEEFRRSIQQQDETYFKWLRGILEDFQNIVMEKLRSYED